MNYLQLLRQMVAGVFISLVPLIGINAYSLSSGSASSGATLVSTTIGFFSTVLLAGMIGVFGFNYRSSTYSFVIGACIATLLYFLSDSVFTFLQPYFYIATWFFVGAMLGLFVPTVSKDKHLLKKKIGVMVVFSMLLVWRTVFHVADYEKGQQFAQACRELAGKVLNFQNIQTLGSDVYLPTGVNQKLEPVNSSNITKLNSNKTINNVSGITDNG